jgi:hypothetical protein
MKIDVNAKDTKDTICKKLETAQKILANAKASPKPKPKPVPPVKKGFDENSIRKDISKLYGKRWMQQYKNVMPSINNDVREMKARLNKMPGKPLKRNINQVKKQLVEKWKNQRKRDLDKKLILKSLNVNGIPRNMVNAYKTGALNYIMTHKPTKAKLARYKKTWVNNKKNTKNAKPVPIVKAKRERMI